MYTVNKSPITTHISLHVCQVTWFNLEFIWYCIHVTFGCVFYLVVLVASCFTLQTTLCFCIFLVTGSCLSLSWRSFLQRHPHTVFLLLSNWYMYLFQADRPCYQHTPHNVCSGRHLILGSTSREHKVSLLFKYS